MTLPQMLAFGILGGMMLLFIWGRLRYDLVAILALLASIAAGTVSSKNAFSGFSDDIVIIVASALVVSAAVARSGIIESGLERLTMGVTRIRWQLTVLVTSVTFLSALVKNIGALAILMPSAFKMAKKSDASPSVFLMPMAFGSLLGGLITLIGTSPNIIVSRVREDMTGEPFGMFDYAPVGLSLAIMGILFLRFGYRLLPRDRRAAPTMGEALDISDYTTEARVTEMSSVAHNSIAALRKTFDHVELTGLVRNGKLNPRPSNRLVLRAGDVVILKGEPEALERTIASANLELEGQDRATITDSDSDSIGVIEAVVTSDSVLVGKAAAKILLHERYGVNLIALSRSGQRLTRGMSETKLRAGDIMLLQGPLGALPGQLRELGCLPLAERKLKLGSVQKRILPIAILAIAMALTAFELVPVAVAFFGAAALVMLTGALPVREAYEHIEWPILIMLGALIPVSEALQTTGGTDLIANWLSATAVSLPPWGAVMLILVAAMAVTPFLNNAATVLVMAPIAATFANDIGLKPEAFLMAVAVGAGCDFLTPIGHQCNTLVMGPGGYRFGDYARLGAPLSLLVILAGVPLILWTWPIY
ncbi:SLC13 family permease [Sphingobium boeckii]|uniref:Di/tricarboxylate transporter n=1 Tax=Sphingobium boeckii TaxID=1082345 RepID=A0A7W9AL79_9SPHN|nr:SLC13 family permease [Sphingobium boeckii]MBB5687730.1 di/tricarboxylate transporter [Sphingobium boeckii]